MENIKIIEYSDSLAKAIAEMWNKSGDNWGGENTLQTEKDIIEEENGSKNKNLFIAMDGDVAAGYCSFSNYEYDKDTLYIPLLNVRPDYHGKKVGKALVLKCVETAIFYNGPRLDLFTWAGNTKAVPLYKKCGFVWERHESEVHLMNFIPMFYSMELLKNKFEDFDWYKDNCRKIEIQPDGKNMVSLIFMSITGKTNQKN